MGSFVIYIIEWALCLLALKEEAIHVVRNMPRWEPGRQNGKRVETTYTLPVSFKLDR